ncbi:MAG: 30S ribosomal protein S30e [Candidatus Hermodarchaeota archaeon]|jgi:small subunit ribosomal protein S30e|nr:30S ribosomal protein S30e [Candidatus Hermodarchaeota archaeon]
MPGSHGSLTKAGKVRSQTPKVEGKVRVTPIPRLRNRRNYAKRILKGTPAGQPKAVRR